MILLLAILLALLARLLCGGSLRELSGVKLRGEAFLLVLLALQTAIPALSLTGTAARVAFWCWIATFPVLVAIALANYRQPGMVILAAGLALNAAVILANAGMPVSGAAIAAVHPGTSQVPISLSDFVHVQADSTTRLLPLADVLPLPGPSSTRAIVSAGDVLLFAGVFTAVAMSGSRNRRAATSL